MGYMYLRKDGHWYYKYKTLDSKGYTKYKCKSCRTKDESTAQIVCKKYDRIYGNLGTNPLLNENHQLVELTEDYLAHRQKSVDRGTLSPNTHRSDFISLHNFINWSRKKYKTRAYMLEDLNKKDFQRYMDDRLEDVSPTTVSRDMRHFSSFLSWLVKKDYMKANFIIGKGLDKPKPKKRVDVPTKDEWKQLWNYVESKVLNTDAPYDFFYNMIWVQMNMGLRIGEIINMKWKEGQNDHSIGHSRSYIFLDPKLTDLTIYFKRRFRQIPLGEVSKSLSRIPKLCKGSKLMKTPMKYVFGNPYTNKERGLSSISRDFKKLLNECGISPRYTSHSLRHGWAVNQIRLGTDIYKVSKFMGHSVIQVTELYANHLSSEDFEDIISNNKPA